MTLNACGNPPPSDITNIIRHPYSPETLLIGPIHDIPEDEEEYLPPTSNNFRHQHRDYNHMLSLKRLIETFASEKDTTDFFFQIVASVAWRESSWRHYVKVDEDIYVLAGDDGDSIGMMQINKRFFGPYLHLKNNLRKGISLLHQYYIKNKDDNNHCFEGSNSSLDSTGTLRRTYASYNGGESNRCRDNHENDNKIEEAFDSEPWNQFLLPS